MRKSIIPILTICLMAATAALAQPGGGRGRSGGGGRSPRSAPPPPNADPAAPPTPRPAPLSENEIVGVIRTIDTSAGRVTIAYEAVDALGWPAGVMPFVVSKAALLQDATVGEKVRFKLESQQISALRPF